MQSPHSFIVKPLQDRRYNNTKNIGGIDFIINTSEEDVAFSNRQAIVLETPLNYNGPIAVSYTHLTLPTTPYV